MAAVPEISAAELARLLDRGEPVQVLDVRAPERVAAARIEAPDFVALPNSRLFLTADLGAAGLDPERPVAVVCDRGFSSRATVGFLSLRGYRAVSVAGGMLAWAHATVVREIDAPAPLDRLLQFERPAKGALAYLLIRADEALLVDPGRDLEPCAAALVASGARLVAVADSHAHADYLSGGPAAAQRWGVPYYLHARDGVSPFDGRPARIPFEPLEDGDRITVGDLEIAIEPTPGHTEGSVTLRVADAFALTGDFLFVGSIGRPDLGGRAASWTAELWTSLQRATATWPSSLLVLPAHFASDGERREDRSIVAPFGEVRTSNPAFAHESAAAFSAWVESCCPEPPAAYRTIKLANLGLVQVDAELADELEAGKNQCALAG